tara:strand:+ start:2784 stop:3065 length:282 start_codon:yes stop_codon:yes gene_type:complete
MLKMESDLVKEILDKNGVTDLDDIEAGTEVYEELYDFYADEMPYGTQKARDGDPVEWIVMKVADLNILDEYDISDEEQERANHIAKSINRGEM